MVTDGRTGGYFRKPRRRSRPGEVSGNTYRAACSEERVQPVVDLRTTTPAAPSTPVLTRWCFTGRYGRRPLRPAGTGVLRSLVEQPIAAGPVRLPTTDPAEPCRDLRLLDEPAFEHDFNHVDYDVEEFDMRAGHLASSTPFAAPSKPRPTLPPTCSTALHDASTRPSADRRACGSFDGWGTARGYPGFAALTCPGLRVTQSLAFLHCRAGGFDQVSKPAISFRRSDYGVRNCPGWPGWPSLRGAGLPLYWPPAPPSPYPPLRNRVAPPPPTE